MATKQRKVVIAAGGTGGHIFPAQALAEELSNSGDAVSLVCDRRTDKFLQGIFAKIERHYIHSNSFNGSILTKLKCLFKLTLSIFELRRYLREQRPTSVVGFGGYPSFPTLAAAISLGIPTIVHEQNSVLGRVNKLFAPFVRAIALGFPQTQGIKSGYEVKTHFVGNPVRANYRDLKPGKKSTKFRLLIIGGSQGAKILSDVVPAAIKLLPKKVQSNLVIHQQVRQNLIDETKAAYDGLKLKVDVQPFYDDLATLMNDCDMIISRAGASSVTEIAELGKASILVPFKLAKDNHQFYNAQHLVRNNAALMFEEDDLTPQSLAKELLDLIESQKKLSSLAKNAKKLGKENAAKALAKLV